MPFIRVGDQVLNTEHIVSVELHFGQRVFEPPDIEDGPASDDGPDRAHAIQADLVRVRLTSQPEPVTFFGAEARALRAYFSDPQHVVPLTDGD